jgi:hypothetical protein
MGDGRTVLHVTSPLESYPEMQEPVRGEQKRYAGTRLGRSLWTSLLQGHAP